MIEVEAKYQVPNEAALLARLQEFAGSLDFHETAETDEYFNHPCRDFVQTDEALRIRRSGDHVELTWKGPRLDTVTKSRRELELPLQSTTQTPEQQQQTLQAILLALGFVSAGIVRKRRQAISIDWADRTFKVSVDHVQGIPLHAEIEILCSESERQEATQKLLELADQLQLQNSERRSYIHLVRLAEADSAH